MYTGKLTCKIGNSGWNASLSLKTGPCRSDTLSLR